MKKVIVSFIVEFNSSQFHPKIKSVKDFVEDQFISEISESMFNFPYQTIRKKFPEPKNKDFIDMNENLSQTVLNSLNYSVLEKSDSFEKTKVVFSFDYVDDAPLSPSVDRFVHLLFDAPIKVKSFIVKDITNRFLNKVREGGLDIYQEFIRAFTQAEKTISIEITKLKTSNHI